VQLVGMLKMHTALARLRFDELLKLSKLNLPVIINVDGKEERSENLVGHSLNRDLRVAERALELRPRERGVLMIAEQ
jgi:hypothetical protein